jgi:hypothetical protein
MSREEYLEAGAKHVDNGEDADIEFLMKNQRKLNGHMLELTGNIKQE